MRKILYLLIATALFASCKKSNTSISRQGDINVTIEGVVYDIDGNTPISGVTVSTSLDGEILTTRTDSNGVYSIKNLNSGSYNLVFSSTSYGSMNKVVDANPEDFTGNHYVANYNLKMYKFDQTLTTRVVIQKGQEYIPAANTPVSIYLSDDFVNNKIADTTDASGNITVSGLPNSTVRLEVDYSSGDYHYYLGSYGSVSELPFNFSNLYILTQENINLFYLMGSNIIVSSTGSTTEAFTNTASIAFQFSNPANLTYQDMVIDLVKVTNGVSVAKAVTWSSSNTKLTIDPIGTALDTSEKYQVNLSLKSVSGIYYPTTGSASFIFQVKSPSYSLNQVSSVSLISPSTITTTTNAVTIQFNNVPNAQKYSVYGQYGTTDEYLYITSLTPSDLTATTYQVDVTLSDLPGITVPTAGLFSNGAPYYLRVRAERTDGTLGSFSEALKLVQ
jgi:hypothetical protein